MDTAGGICSRLRFQPIKPVRMSKPATPSSPSRAGDDRNLVAVDATTAITFEDRINLFWKNNRTVVLALCGLVIVGIVGKGGWDYLARQREADIGKAYAAATTTEQLKSFSAAHDGHSLAGIAQLRLADEAYTAGKSADAITGYEKAAAALKTGPLAVRAKMGRALARLQSGKTAEATAELKLLADDANQFKSVRAEAAYHLTGLAVEAGNAAEAQKLVEQLMQIDPDPQKSWTQRAMMLRATLPATPAPEVVTPAPGAPAAEKKDEPTTPVLQLNLPGKK